MKIMPKMKKSWKSGALCVVVLGGGAAAAWAMSSGVTLKMNGRVASSDVRTMGGKTYVPLADVAKSLGMVVVKRGNGWEIRRAGGTYQVGKLSGKIGDVLFDGKWRLQVLSVASPAVFSMQTDSDPYNNSDVSIYDRTTRTLRPKTGYKLVVIQVRVTNGQKTRQTLWTSISDDKMNTALTDFDGQSHPPLVYDYEGGNNVTKPLLPGANFSFPVIFSVRENVRLKDLIWTLKNNESFVRGTDVRVSLTP